MGARVATLEAKLAELTERRPPGRPLAATEKIGCGISMMGPLHATIEEFAVEGYTHIECFCPHKHCRHQR